MSSARRRISRRRTPTSRKATANRIPTKASPAKPNGPELARLPSRSSNIPEGEGEEGDEQTVEVEADDMPMDGDADETSEGNQPWRPNQQGDDRNRQPSYKIFTQQFDETIAAEDLWRPGGTFAAAARTQQLQQMQDKVSRRDEVWGEEEPDLGIDLEEGVLEAARLTRAVVDPTLPLAYKVEHEMDFRDTVVTLLLDNSGSMRGRPITVAAMSRPFSRERWSAARSRSKSWASRRGPGRVDNHANAGSRTANRLSPAA